MIILGGSHIIQSATVVLYNRGSCRTVYRLSMDFMETLPES